jgi:LemA protein
MAFIVLLLALAAVALYVIAIYNSLIRLKNLCEEAWSGIDVQLKKRYNLIPNLVNTVKGYARHEKEVLENVVEKRSAGIQAKTVKEQEEAELALSRSLVNLLALAENYPDLKANQNFLDLQRQLQVIEDDIQKARRYYNGTVRDFNIRIESFPSNLVAQQLNFAKREFFELDNADQRQNPVVDFS